MTILTFYYCCTFFYLIKLCTACKPLQRCNFLNDQSDIKLINEMLKPFKKVVPFYNNVTMPNYGKVIEEFQRGKANPDVYLNFTQLVTKYGYPVEQHEVKTEDGYLLTMYRIPKACGPPVILMHGLACSSDEWITAGVDVSLAYHLADAGYDVWLPNARGNKHSRKHVVLSPDCEEFWEFSYDEIALYDLPAVIDYALKHTAKSKLSYIGHSEGSTDFFAMASTKPEYNDKISIMIALSAVVFMGHVRFPLIQLAAPFIDETGALCDLVGIFEVLARDKTLDVITSTFFGSPKIAEIFCANIVFLGCGFDYPQLNITNLPVIFSHYTSGTTFPQIIQYGQSKKTGNFSMFNHGLIKNMAKYGSLKPPDYALEKVTSPTAIFYSKNDWLTSAPDILKLLKVLPNVVELYHIPCSSYNHVDYIIAKDNSILINKEITNLLNKYADNSTKGCHNVANCR